MKRLNYKNIFLILLLIFLSLAFNIYYGYLGIFPIDSFLIFDSGYYVLNGFFPFKDYWTITGPLLDYFQAFLFLIFGVNWFSYVIHAALINLILALFSYSVFVQLGLKNFYSFIYSVGVALLAYPHIGTPFIAHHSTIFSLLSIYCFILGIKNKNNFFWFLIPLFLGFSFLSKQIPASYIIIFILIILFFYFFYNFDFKKVYFFILGSLFTLLIFFLIFFINQIPFDNFLIQYIFYPMSIGSDRIENLNFSLKGVIGQFKFIYICLIPLILIFFKIILRKEIFKKEKKNFFIIFLIIGSTLIFIYTQLLARNQIFIYFLIPIVTAFSQIYFFNYFKSKYLIYIIIGVCLFSVTKYHIRFNEQKKFMELANVNLELAVNGNKIHKIFNGLKWITPHYPNNPEEEVKNLLEIKDYLDSDPKNKIIISDYQFFSAISNAKFSSPNKWYDDLSTPNKDNKYFKNYYNFFFKKIKQNQIELIYTIGIDKSLYFEDFIDNKNCADLNRINDLLITYNISNCKF